MLQIHSKVTMKNPKICLAEDNDGLRQAMAERLTQYGFEVHEFWDGTQAWEAIRVNRFDLVVSDVYMPNMGGMELLEHIRAIEVPVPVILMSANYPARSALAHGAAAFISKPFSVEELLDQIHTTLSHGTQRCDSRV